MNQPDFSLSGAVDLGARKATADRRAQQSQAGQPGGQQGDQQGGGSPYVVEVTEETFNTEVVERSRTVPVVVDVWADWCQPCKQLSPILEKLADEYAGQWVLAKVDADANPRLTQALQVQSLPNVLAVAGGQAVNLFQGALPEAQVRQAIDQLLAAVSGQAPPEGAEQEQYAQQQAPAEANEAAEALESGDLDGAEAAYHRLRERDPNDATAASGLALVEILRRAQSVDENAARQEAASRPDDAAAQGSVADLELLSGQVEEAFNRLIGTIRRSSGEDRDRARVWLLQLFEVLPDSDPRVAKARGALANALF